MHHGTLTPEIARGLLRLQDRIAAAGLPSSKLDETLLVATWNVRELGKKPRLDASLHYIAEVLGCFDLVCLVEVRDDVRDLSTVLRYLGPYWRVVFSDYIADDGGTRERVAFVYDERAVLFTGLASNMLSARTRHGVEYVDEISWWRPPYLASFRAGNFDFLVVGAHIRWGDTQANRQRELEKLADWIAGRSREKFVYDKDIVLVGDFNIPSTKSALYEAVTAKGLPAPAGILGIEHGSNLAKDKRYDQILVAPQFPESVTGRAGVLDIFGASFQPLYEGIATKTDAQLTFEVSDHLPLWMEMNTDDDGYRLEQILGPVGK